MGNPQNYPLDISSDTNYVLSIDRNIILYYLIDLYENPVINSVHQAPIVGIQYPYDNLRGDAKGIGRMEIIHDTRIPRSV